MLVVKGVHILSGNDIYFTIPLFIEGLELTELVPLLFREIRKMLKYEFYAIHEAKIT